MAPLAALTGHYELSNPLAAVTVPDLVDLGVHPRQEFLTRQERLDIDRAEEDAGGPRLHVSREAGAGEHAAEGIDEQRQPKALVRCDRTTEGG